MLTICQINNSRRNIFELFVNLTNSELKAINIT